MIKFIYKKHLNEGKNSGNILVYYNLSDIVLGFALLALCVFFINDYLSHNLNQYRVDPDFNTYIGYADGPALDNIYP